MFLGNGLGQQMPIPQTRLCDGIEKSPECSWGVPTASYVFLNIPMICLQFAITSVLLLLTQSSLSNEPNFVLIASLSRSLKARPDYNCHYFFCHLLIFQDETRLILWR